MTKMKDRILRTEDITEEFMEKWRKTFGRMEIVENMEDKAMNKKEFDEKYAGERIVVSCKTKDLLREFLELADSFGHKWWTKKRYSVDWNFKDYSVDRYYWLYEGAHCSIQDVKYYSLKVVEFESLNYVNLNDKDNSLVAMTKEQFYNKYAKGGKVVHCPTEALAKKVLELADSFGYKWHKGESLIGDNRWEDCKDVTCYNFQTDDVVYYGEKDVYKEQCDCDIITFDENDYIMFDLYNMKKRIADYDKIVEATNVAKELNEQIKVMSKVLESYKPPKIEIGIRTEDFVKNAQSIQTIPIEEAYKIEAKTESMDEVLVDIVKEKIDDLHQEIEAFQMTIDEFREKIGNNLEKIEMLEEIIEDCEDSLRCEEYEKKNYGNNGDFNTDDYWRSPY